MEGPRAFAVVALLVVASAAPSVSEAVGPCSRRSCKPAITTNCAGLARHTRRICARRIRATCRAARCSCTGGLPACEGTTIAGVGGHCGGFIMHAPICAAPLVCRLNPTPDTGGICENP